jgi:protein-S-isoprenylcysteine O-methyltransferase Ste14
MAATTAASIALALFAVFGVLGFGWRSWLQYRRTGSSGFRATSSRIGSTEWIAGVGVAVALVVAVSAPILQRVNLIAPLGALSAAWIQAAGIAVAIVGIAATLYAQLAMGDSWRLGVDVRETTTLVRTGVTLVRTGVFARVRNPIYTAMFAFGLGIALVTPNVVACAGFILLVAAIELQVRRVEEPHLLRIHGDAYRAYTATVGRFIPGVGLIR